MEAERFVEGSVVDEDGEEGEDVEHVELEESALLELPEIENVPEQSPSALKCGTDSNARARDQARR